MKREKYGAAARQRRRVLGIRAGQKTRAAYAVSARLFRFIQDRLTYDSISEHEWHEPAFREVLAWANEQLGNPSVAEMDRWESFAPSPETKL